VAELQHLRVNSREFAGNPDARCKLSHMGIDKTEAEIDDETNAKVWVERWEDAVRASELALNPKSDVGTDPGLDIPF
jgi:hypothetical protein